jgi:hypothetical protein
MLYFYIIYFMFMYILWSFGLFYIKPFSNYMVIWCCDNLEYFSPLWYIVSRKIWQPCVEDDFFAPSNRKKTKLGINFNLAGKFLWLNSKGTVS